ncbi:MAG: transcriptional repressor [Sphaerochaetaceae bacterium]|nr:transcriptional repressor [Sphaerochaetaceae bacterium]MDC7247128.1 transcriptional repressor [Sphaerochaetaceae bacterium]
MTKARTNVLEILTGGEHPLTAQQISSLVADKINQVTVYRTLHYLENNGYCESFLLHCTKHGTERYYVPLVDEKGNHCKHHHWFHCEKCHQFIDLGSCKIDTLIESYTKDLDIKVLHHNLSLSGICRSCRQNGE